MNELVVAVSEDVLERALRRLEPAETSPASPGGTAPLNAPKLSALQVAFSEAWDKLTDMVRKCAREGARVVEKQVSDFLTYLDRVATDLGASADQFRTLVLAKVREAIGAAFEELLACLRGELVVGNQRYVLDSLSLEQKLLYSGSLEASVTTLCKFVGGGELVVKGAYKLASP